MELIDRIGGLGKIRVTNEESRAIAELEGIVSRDGQKCFIRQDCEHTQRYQTLMKSLFSTFETKDQSLLRPFCRENNQYKGFGNATEIVVGNHLPDISRTLGQVDVELRIITPKPPERIKNEYWMTLVLHSQYKPDTVDDIVTILGNREKSIITEAQYIKLKTDDATRREYYGIADVPRLGEIIELYRRADVLVGHAHQIVGATKDQLGILRRDAKDHGNLFIREGSAMKYQKMLEDLTQL